MRLLFWLFFLLCLLSVVPDVSMCEKPLKNNSSDLLIPKIDITSDQLLNNADSNKMMDSPLVKKLSALLFNEYALAIFITVVVIGILMGFKGAITVFRDYNDLGMIFILGLVPVTSGGLGFLNSSDFFAGYIAVLVLVIESAILFFLFFRTLRDNPNLLLAIIAFMTKLPLSLLFLVHVINIAAPGGKTFYHRSRERRTALIWLMLLSPIIYKLVRNKTGFFNPDGMIKTRTMIR